MGSGGESDNEEPQEEKKSFFVDRAKSGRAACKNCKQKIDANMLRLARAAYNPFGPGPMKQWHHVQCLFEIFKKQRPTTARINTPDDIDGWSDIDEEDQLEILQFLPHVNPEEYKTEKKEKPAATPKKPKGKKAKGTGADEDDEKEKKPPKGGSAASSTAVASALPKGIPDHKDNTFREFRRLCVNIANESSYLSKTAVVKEFFTKGTNGDGFKGDLQLWVKLLLPGAIKRVYNLQSKQLIKLFSRILHEDQDEMLKDLEKGDVAETICTFFEGSKHCCPVKKSNLTIQEVDTFLQELSQLTREDDQANLFIQICGKCTANDLRSIIRLVKCDLRINAGPKHILEALHPDAYLAFQTSRDIDSVLEEIFTTNKSKGKETSDKSLNIGVKLMTPVLPMLAEACKSVEQALKKCPNGMYSEIKYDGERVQVHKCGNEFKYFSRSLKPVMPHKVKEFKEYIPKAFPGGEDLILDSEILMIDTTTGTPLPFGTLGIHKKGELKDACVCLFVFDCIYYNGNSLLHMPIRKRRKILHENMTEVPNRIVFSEMKEVHSAKDLEAMMTKVFQMGLEGLVLKDLESPYEPGKRHWLKVKKDYLFGGAMADTADLVVLGAWFGTGQKGGMMSVFLMGCWDPVHKSWCTVTKVHTGHDDKTLERLQSELEMEKISKEIHRVPPWLKCTKTMVPDFVAKDPKTMPVWEITGAEFTQHDVHTAAGISIRFPRVTRIRDDKTWESATNLPELKELFRKSKDSSDFSLPAHFASDDHNSESDSPKKQNGKKSKVDDEEGMENSTGLRMKTVRVNSQEREPTTSTDSPKQKENSGPRSPSRKQSKSSEESKMSTKSSANSSETEEELSISVKKRRRDDSPEINQPIKKEKLEEPTNKIAEDASESELFNKEFFIKSLISELSLITNKILYHKVKQKLFDVIHEAQEEQIILNTSKCVCQCFHCFLVARNHNPSKLVSDKECINEVVMPTSDCEKNTLNNNGKVSSEGQIAMDVDEVFITENKEQDTEQDESHELAKESDNEIKECPVANTYATDVSENNKTENLPRINSSASACVSSPTFNSKDDNEQQMCK